MAGGERSRTAACRRHGTAWHRAHAEGTTAVLGITVRHLVTPEELQGRVNTTARMLAWGGQPVGAALAGAFVGPAGLVATLLGGAVLLGAAGLGAAVAARIDRPARSSRKKIG